MNEYPQACPFSNSCLGMCEWTGCPGATMTSKSDSTPSFQEQPSLLAEQPSPPAEQPSPPSAEQPSPPAEQPSPPSAEQPSPPAEQPGPLSTVSIPVPEPVPSIRRSLTPLPPVEPLTLEQPSTKRFKFSTEDEISSLSKGVKPLNTSRQTRWALKTFKAWCDARNSDSQVDSVPDNLLETQDVAALSKHLSRFVVEVRKENGEHYPPATVHQILCGILRYMRDISYECPNFLDKSDGRFKDLHGTLDAYFHNLHSQGIGREVKHAEVFTAEEEDQLWESGVCGLNSPTALQNAAFYVVGKMFCLRGGAEHRELKKSQLHRYINPDRYVYIENVSKTNNGSFRHLHLNNKEVPICACPDAGNRCPVVILDKYIGKLPTNNDLFYLRPLEKFSEFDGEPWYSAVPVGKNTLAVKVKRMCESASIGGNKTNHSLRATGATTLFEQGVPEKIIQQRTAHRNIDALRVYERTNMQQHQQVSNLLAKRGPSSSIISPLISQSSSIHQQHQSYSNTTTSSTTRLPATPYTQFRDLHGCTLNFVYPQATSQHSQSSSTNIMQDDEIDRIFASLHDI